MDLGNRILPTERVCGCGRPTICSGRRRLSVAVDRACAALRAIERMAEEGAGVMGAQVLIIA